MEKRIKVEAPIQIPRVPNFFQMADGQTIPISAIKEDGLKEVGRLWTEALIERAQEQGNRA